jgi:hypothetical protein
MPRTFADYMYEARQHEACRGMGENELESLTWRSVQDICAENDLAFMIGEGRIQTEESYDTGTVAVTDAGTGITLTDGTWVTTWTKRRIRIQGATEFYDISTFGSTTTATMGTAWQGDTESGLTYEMYRDIYSMPADCAYSKELLLWDVTNGRRIEFVDYPEFRENKRTILSVTGEPTEATRLGVITSGSDVLAQIEFGPEAPASSRTILLDYYKSPTKPATISTALSPGWPAAFDDVIWLRTIWKYADQRGHPRRFECEQKYKRRIFELNAKFDGGNEMRRRLRASAEKRTRPGLVVGARWTGS